MNKKYIHPPLTIDKNEILTNNFLRSNSNRKLEHCISSYVIEISLIIPNRSSHFLLLRKKLRLSINVIIHKIQFK